ncbi:unnamed protein product [Adineta ricciae]|uniref:Uncharacterized protein n=1 Tax=Adineta ricciae TaxID=249248 RepID=A0A814EZP9_ADIRI|nr:unnamed protein product [Adineta ricciae]CAF1386541.1 unnamed protein product [Adineta ricciae]
MERQNSSDSSISSHSSNDDDSNVNLDSSSTPPVSTAMDKGYYRQVPYRFFTNEANTDSCKLERLTNLFPDMKETIELELFKSNSLSRTVDRLSRIYTVLTALDTRDDTLHLFLGPYHLSLGPALFAALHFKNASAALLVASRPTAGTSNGSENQRRKRRRENVLRRFRRAVRKLTLVKSIVDQLRPASVLTPYNQYELQQQGIYDLVLAGRTQNADSMYANEDFLEQLAKFDTVSSTGERSPLLASNYVKINNLLNLLSTPSQQQQHQQHYSQTYESNPTATTEKIMRMKSSESLVNTINHSNDNNNNNSANNPGNILNSESCCCSQHRPTSPFIMFPVNQTVSPQPSQLLSSKPRSRANSNSNLLRTPAVLSRQSTTNSLPDSASGDISTSDLPSSTSLLTSPQSNPVDIDLNTPTNFTTVHPFLSSTSCLSPPTTNDEDDLINRISSLLASHLLSRQSTTTTTSITLNTAHEHETNSNLSDSAISLSTTGTTGAVSSVVTSNQLSSAIGTNDFDKLFQRIKTAVDNRLSIETNSNNRMRSLSNTIAMNNENNHNNNHNSRYNLMRSGTINRRQQLLALHAVSCQEAHTDDYDAEHSPSSNQKHKLDRLSKSQSFDATTLILPSSKVTSKSKLTKASSLR